MKKIVTQLVDDLDGTVIEAGAGRTVSLSLDGRGWELDLSDANIDKLKTALDPFLSAARSTGSRGSASRGAAPRRARTASAKELAEVRTWAGENGYSVGNRGRISAEVRDAYDSAHA